MDQDQTNPSEMTETSSSTQGQDSQPNDVATIFGGGDDRSSEENNVDNGGGDDSHQQQDAGDAGNTTDAGQQQQQPAQQQPQGLDVKEIARSIVEAQALAAQQAQQRQQPAGSDDDDAQLTDAQFNQKYGIVQITPDHIQQLFHQDPKVAAQSLNGMLQATARQSVLMAQALFQKELKQLSSQIAPLQKLQAEQREKELFTTFITKFPDLKDEQELVVELAHAHLAKGTKFNNPEHAMEVVAGQARQLLARFRGGNQNGGQAQQPNRQQQSSQSRQSGRTMTPVLTGGRSGSGPKQTPNDIQAIFGRR